MTIEQLDYSSSDITTSTTNNVMMLGKSPPPYQSVGIVLLKDYSLMGAFPSNASRPSPETTTVNMISSTIGGMSKGKEIVEMPSLSMHETLYDAIQSISDAYIDDHHLVA